MKKSIMIFPLFFTLALSAADKAKGFMGIMSSPLSKALSMQMNLKDNQGILVQKILKGSPAEKAGIQKYDILLKINDDSISDHQSLRALVKKYSAGDEVAVSLIHKGQAKTLNVKLDEAPVNMLSKRPFMNDMRIPKRFLEIEQRLEESRRMMEERMKELRLNHFDMNEDLNRILEDLARDPNRPGHFKFNGQNSRTIIQNDGNVNIKITEKDNDKKLLIRDNNGDLIFEGPINTQEELQKVPEEFRNKIKALDKKVIQIIKPTKEKDKGTEI